MIEVPERNLEAYRMLYQIENYLRKIVKDPPYNASLFDLIEIVEQNHIIRSDAILKLYWIVEVRNKVCHMQEINEREYGLLFEVWETILSSTNHISQK